MKTTAVVGHESVVTYLNESFANGHPNHAFLLTGPEQIGKSTIIKTLLKNIFCEKGKACGKCQACLSVEGGNHPDVWWIERAEDKQDISIDQVRELQKFINLNSLSGSWRVVVVNGAHQLNEQSANALLKSLEEPMQQVIFFLISSEPKRLLATIRSRCFILQLGLVSFEIIEKMLIKLGAEPKEASELAHRSGGRPGLAVRYWREPELLKKEDEYAQLFWRLIRADGFKDYVKFIEIDIKESTENDKAARQIAMELTSTWQKLARDLIMFKLNLCSQITFLKYEQELKNNSGLPILNILQLNNWLQKTQQALAANAHIKLTLEALGFKLGLLDNTTSFKQSA